jgi:hypothetical protein
MLVIADLLGVPKEDHNEVRRVLASIPGAGGRPGDLERVPRNDSRRRIAIFLVRRELSARGSVWGGSVPPD